MRDRVRAILEELHRQFDRTIRELEEAGALVPLRVYQISDSIYSGKMEILLQLNAKRQEQADEPAIIEGDKS